MDWVQWVSADKATCGRLIHGLVNGDSFDKLRHPRSDAYSAEQVLLNKQQISGGGAYPDCYPVNSWVDDLSTANLLESHYKQLSDSNFLTFPQTDQFVNRPARELTSPQKHWPQDGQPAKCPARCTIRTIHDAPLTVDLCVLDVRVFDCRVVVLDEHLLKELNRQRRLADSSVTHDYHPVGCHVVKRRLFGHGVNSSLALTVAHSSRNVVNDLPHDSGPGPTDKKLSRLNISWDIRLSRYTRQTCNVNVTATNGSDFSLKLLLTSVY